MDDIQLTSLILLEGLVDLMMKILFPLLHSYFKNLVLMSSLQIDDIYHKTQRLDVHSYNDCLPSISLDMSYVV